MKWHSLDKAQEPSRSSNQQSRLKPRFLIQWKSLLLIKLHFTNAISIRSGSTFPRFKSNKIEWWISNICGFHEICKYYLTFSMFLNTYHISFNIQLCVFTRYHVNFFYVNKRNQSLSNFGASFLVQHKIP